MQYKCENGTKEPCVFVCETCKKKQVSVQYTKQVVKDIVFEEFMKL